MTHGKVRITSGWAAFALTLLVHLIIAVSAVTSMFVRVGFIEDRMDRQDAAWDRRFERIEDRLFEIERDTSAVYFEER